MPPIEPPTTPSRLGMPEKIDEPLLGPDDVGDGEQGEPQSVRPAGRRIDGARAPWTRNSFR